MPEVRGSKGGPSTGARWNPTQKLDQSLVERFRQDPKAFQRSIQMNLLVALVLLVFSGFLGFVAFKWVGIAAGGLALITMAFFPLLIALADLDDVRWRMALVRRNGVPLPPRPPLRQWIKGMRAPAPKAPAAAASAPAPSKDA